MSYIDGYVVPAKTARKQEYIDKASDMARRFVELGAIRVVECWGDDVPAGKVTDLRRAVAAEADETVVFSWCEWPSKEVRDAAMKKMERDPAIIEGMKDKDQPFSMQRMIFGGFTPVVDQGRRK